MTIRHAAKGGTILAVAVACAFLASCKTAPYTTGPHPIGTNQQAADGKDGKAVAGSTPSGDAPGQTTGRHPSSGN